MEVFGQITNIHQHINDVRAKKEELIASIARNYDQMLAHGMREETFKQLDAPTPAANPADPLRSELGLYRILRTSPLTEVPFICCTEC